MKNKLEKLGLNSDNSVVIGSGILQVLGIRKSNDIDLVVGGDSYARLKRSKKFQIASSYNREVLKYDEFEIGTAWNVLGKQYKFDDFVKENSLVIGGARYTTLDFLYNVKKDWSKQNDARQKDIEDVKLIEEYLKKHV